MSLIKELTDGTLKITVQDDGTETITRRPPTALALRAANALKDLQLKLEGLSRAYTSLELQYTRNLEEYQKLYEKCGMVPEPVVEAGFDSVRPIHGSTEESSSESKA